MSKLIKLTIASLLLASLPLLASAQGRVAVVNLEEAILQTDEAQQRLTALREAEDYKADKDELDRLQAEREELIKKVQNDMAVMSAEQQQAARKSMASKNADLEHVLRKLQQAEQELGQQLLAEMTPKVQAVLRDLIQSEGIGLLLQQAEQELGQQLLAEMTPKVQAVLRDLIQSEGIGLLLQRSAVIHADQGYSITAKVTDKLNQQAAAGE